MDAWKRRHLVARKDPAAGFERGLVTLIDGLRTYAEAHRARYEAPIAEDYVLGDEWHAAVKAVVGLLNGELGRLDGGSLWQELESLALEAGFEGGLEGRTVYTG